jgi:hypothetical protein
MWILLGLDTVGPGPFAHRTKQVLIRRHLPKKNRGVAFRDEKKNAAKSLAEVVKSGLRE